MTPWTAAHQASQSFTISQSLLKLMSTELVMLSSHLIIRIFWWLSGKESACQCRRCKRHRFDPWVGMILWRRAWQATPVFLPGKFYGQSCPPQGFPGGAMINNLPANAGDARDKSLIPGLGKSPRGGNGNPLWYSCLENLRDGGAGRAKIHGVTKSWT